jgi:hypothetical protein
MMHRWVVTVQVWPHSTGRGFHVDQIQAGSREWEFEVEGAGMADALRNAELIVMGIKTNPIVWEVPIKKIEQLEPGERLTVNNFAKHDEDLTKAAKLQMPSSSKPPVAGISLAERDDVELYNCVHDLKKTKSETDRYCVSVNFTDGSFIVRWGATQEEADAKVLKQRLAQD